MNDVVVSVWRQRENQSMRIYVTRRTISYVPIVTPNLIWNDGILTGGGGGKAGRPNNTRTRWVAIWDQFRVEKTRR